MGVSTIDGTLEEAVLKKVRRNLRVYERLTFRLADGGTRSIAKAIVDAPVAERLVPGTTGRFYLYTAIDHRGVHGLRDSAGHSVCSYPTNNEKALLVVTPLLLLMVVIMLVVRGGLMILPTLVLLISIPFYFVYRSTRLAAQRQYDADGGYAAPSAPVAAAAPAGGG